MAKFLAYELTGETHVFDQKVQAEQKERAERSIVCGLIYQHMCTLEAPLGLAMGLCVAGMHMRVRMCSD